MFDAVYVSKSGKSYTFGTSNNTVFSMKFGGGISSELSKQQGFLQVGESVTASSVSGRSFIINGAIYGSGIPEKKKLLRSVFAPMTSGTLTIEGDYSIDLWVSNSPDFYEDRTDGRFSIKMFAPNPFFKSTKESVVKLGSTIPLFSFPINYAAPHMFGAFESKERASIENKGDVAADARFYIYARSNLTNPTIYCGDKYLQYSSILGEGEGLEVCKDSDGDLSVVRIFDGGKSNDIGLLNDTSTFFEVPVGKNMIIVKTDDPSEIAEVTIRFNETVVSIFES